MQSLAEQIKQQILDLPLEERFELVADIIEKWENYLPEQFRASIINAKICRISEKLSNLLTSKTH